VSAYAALSLLDERAQQGQSGIMRNWAQGWMNWSKQNLAIWKQYATDDRYMTTGQGQWSVSKFNKAALTGGVNITCEFGAFRPQTFVGRRALIEQAVRLGFLNIQDPQEVYTALQAMGIPELMPDFKADQEFVSRTIDMIVNGVNVPPPMPWENHPLAISIYRRYMMSETFEALPDITKHSIFMQTQAHFMAMQAVPRQQGPGQNAPGPGGPKGVAAGPGGSNEANPNEPGTAGEQAVMHRDQQQPTHPEMNGQE
jgi:hypothetical protein